MPLYLVKAAHAQTGEDVELEIDARDKFAAERAARERGYMVERVEFATLDYVRTPEARPGSSSVLPIVIVAGLIGAGVLALAWWALR